MQIFYKFLIVLLLLFNGIGALFGGWNLMVHPDGSSIQLSMDWLRNTPFKNYFIPGLILFVANGLFSIFTAMIVLLNSRNNGWFVIAQGAILFGWIVIQILFIQTIYYLHIILGLTGIGLMLLGLQRVKRKNFSPQ